MFLDGPSYALPLYRAALAGAEIAMRRSHITSSAEIRSLQVLAAMFLWIRKDDLEAKKALRVLLAAVDQSSSLYARTTVLFTDLTSRASKNGGDEAGPFVLKAMAYASGLSTRDRQELTWVNARLLFRRQKYQECVTQLDHLAHVDRADPLVEQALILLVKADAKLGDRAAAQREYERWASRFKGPKSLATDEAMQQEILDSVSQNGDAISPSPAQ